MNAWSGVAWLVVAAALVTTVPAHASDGSQIQVTDPPLVVAGTQTASLEGGAVHLHSGSPPEGFHLDAERLAIDHAWIRGQEADGGTGSNLLARETERGHETASFDDARVRIEEAGGDPTEILAYPGSKRPVVEATGEGAHAFARLDVEHLTAVGESPSAHRAGDTERVGFWFSPAEEWLLGHGNDEVVVQGNFSLFVNNATVTIEERGEATWENRTGSWEEQQTPATRSYERHLLRIHVTEGTLRLEAQDALAILGPRLALETEGVVTAEAVSGRLRIDGTTLAFSDDPLRIDGRGSLQVAETAEGVGPPGLSLAVGEGSAFDLHGGEPVETTATASLGGATEPWILVGGLALIGLATAAYRRQVGAKLLQRWRTHRYTKWMTRGRELARSRDYDTAVDCFRRARRAQPAEGVAWYHQAMASLEVQRPEDALALVDEARRQEVVIDELDFLELEAVAACQMGDLERCRAALAQLAERSLLMARSLVHDLNISEETLGPELAKRLAPGHRDHDDEEEGGEGLRGYV